MKHRVYGYGGKPVVAFPTSEAHLNQWEDFGMVDALAPYIEEGYIQLFAMDSIDEETFFRHDRRRDKAIRRYDQYLKYITNEFMPTVIGAPGSRIPRGVYSPSGGGGVPGTLSAGAVRAARRNARGAAHHGRSGFGSSRDSSAQKVLLTGCSMGAFHAANIYFRWPQYADSLIALSGVYTPRHFMKFDKRMSRSSFANSTLDYMSHNLDPAKRALYESSRLVFCTGQGDGEQDMLVDTIALGEILEAQEIPAWVDVWGEDVTHDWPWWTQQMQYFLPQVLGLGDGAE